MITNRAPTSWSTPQQSVPARYIDPKAKNRSRIYYQLANLQAQRMEDGRQRPAHRRARVHHRGHRKQRLLRPQRGGPDAQAPRYPAGGLKTGMHGTRRKAESSPSEKPISNPTTSVTPTKRGTRRRPSAWSPSHASTFSLSERDVPARSIGQLIDAWSEDVGVDIPAQAREYAKRAKSWAP